MAKNTNPFLDDEEFDPFANVDDNNAVFENPTPSKVFPMTQSLDRPPNPFADVAPQLGTAKPPGGESNPKNMSKSVVSPVKPANNHPKSSPTPTPVQKFTPSHPISMPKTSHSTVIESNPQPQKPTKQPADAQNQPKPATPKKAETQKPAVTQKREEQKSVIPLVPESAANIKSRQVATNHIVQAQEKPQTPSPAHDRVEYQETFDFEVQEFLFEENPNWEICKNLEQRLKSFVCKSIQQIQTDSEKNQGHSTSHRNAIKVEKMNNVLKNLPELLYKEMNGEDKNVYLPAYWNDDKPFGKESTRCFPDSNEGIWGVVVGEKFDLSWFPPQRSCRIHINTSICRIYLFWR